MFLFNIINFIFIISYYFLYYLVDYLGLNERKNILLKQKAEEMFYKNKIHNFCFINIDLIYTVNTYLINYTIYSILTTSNTLLNLNIYNNQPLSTVLN